MNRGERAVCLYLLTRGEVVIRYKPYDGEPINLNRIQPGGVFGWSAVLGNSTYSSSLICTQACEVLVICGQDLQTLMNDHPQTGRVVLDRLARAVAFRRSNAEAQVKAMLNEGIKKKSAPIQEGESVMSVASAKEQQLRALIENISAYIEQFHGGSVEFVSFNGETLKVKMGGACLGCPLSPSTLHGWVEGTVHQFFPEIHIEAA